MLFKQYQVTAKYEEYGEIAHRNRTIHHFLTIRETWNVLHTASVGY